MLNKLSVSNSDGHRFCVVDERLVNLQFHHLFTSLLFVVLGVLQTFPRVEHGFECFGVDFFDHGAKRKDEVLFYWTEMVLCSSICT